MTPFSHPDPRSDLDPDFNIDAAVRRARGLLLQESKRLKRRIPYHEIVRRAADDGTIFAKASVGRALNKDRDTEKIRTVLNWINTRLGGGPVSSKLYEGPIGFEEDAYEAPSLSYLSLKTYLSTARAVHELANTDVKASLDGAYSMMGTLGHMTPEACPYYYRRLSGVALGIANCTDKPHFSGFSHADVDIAYQRLQAIKQLLDGADLAEMPTREDQTFHRRAYAYYGHALAFIGFFHASCDPRGKAGASLIQCGMETSLLGAVEIVSPNGQPEKEGLWRNVFFALTVCREMRLECADPLANLVRQEFEQVVHGNEEAAEAIRLPEYKDLATEWGITH